ncbi:MAG: hypothetical protein ABWY54_04870, partial [Glaciihabitans sp.]
MTLRRALAFTAVAMLSAGLLSGCADDRSAALPTCVATPAAAAVPEEGVLYGVNLDWGRESLQQYATSVGHRPAVTVAFSDVPLSEEDRSNVMAAVTQIRAVGGSLLLTLEPSGGLATVTDGVAADLAEFSAEINDAG